MASLRAFLFALLILAMTPLRADARCQGAVQLGGLHDAYRATLFETGQTRTLAAMSLLVFVGQQDGAKLAQHIERAGAESSQEKLDNILSAAANLAQATLTGVAAEEDSFQHGRNVQYLAGLFAATGCENSPSTASMGVAGTAWGGESEAVAPKDPTAMEKLADSNILMPALLVGGLIAVFGVYKFYTSLTMRQRRVERLPRSPISLALIATFTSEEGEMEQAETEALDISQGGMKVNWPDAPEAGTTVSFKILERERLAKIAWSNSYYAGIVFDETLNKQELKTLKES